MVNPNLAPPAPFGPLGSELPMNSLTVSWRVIRNNNLSVNKFPALPAGSPACRLALKRPERSFLTVQCRQRQEFQLQLE